ncbi:MAG: stage II sporulation protein M [Gammaproteobacteria bacterium]|nr:stage II sporulation protein M [Gammaproteobacteria bacterium]
MNGDKATSRWFEERLPVWQDTAEKLSRIERGSASPPDTVLAAVRAYPELARDLSIARREAPGGPLTRRLERLYLELHRCIFRRPGNLRRDLANLFRRDAPAAALRLRWHILSVALLFAGSAAAGAWLVHTYPELAALFASEGMIATVEQGQLWTDGLLNVTPSSLLAVSIFTNNIAVSLFAVCLGTLYGLGTVYIIGMNGMMIGAAFAFTAQHDVARRLFEFVAAHGFVELSVIAVAGAVGVSLGEALARPGRASRAAAFQRATTQGMKLMGVCVPFLIGAGLIEGYVSPNPSFPLAARLVIGLGYLALFVAVLLPARAGRRAPGNPPG